MKDSQGNLVLGRTRWRRFAAVVVPATIAVTALMGGVASGAVPVAMTVSGQTAMLSADRLDATGFSQFGGVVVKKDGTVIPVAVSQIKYAEITNLCQSVKIPGTDITLFIRGGREAGRPVIAKELLIGMDHLSGDAVVHQHRHRHGLLHPDQGRAPAGRAGRPVRPGSRQGRHRRSEAALLQHPRRRVPAHRHEPEPQVRRLGVLQHDQAVTPPAFRVTVRVPRHRQHLGGIRDRVATVHAVAAKPAVLGRPARGAGRTWRSSAR